MLTVADTLLIKESDREEGRICYGERRNLRQERDNKREEWIERRIKVDKLMPMFENSLLWLKKYPTSVNHP